MSWKTDVKDAEWLAELLAHGLVRGASCPSSNCQSSRRPRLWRKTVPKSWLGCGELAESAPCKKMAELDGELSQWDEVQRQIENLAPERASQFLARNESRIMLYLDTYVPDEPSAEAMKDTAFYKKNLASVMDGWSEGGGGANMKDL